MKQKKSIYLMAIIIFIFLCCCISTKAEESTLYEKNEMGIGLQQGDGGSQEKQNKQTEEEIQQKVMDYSISLFDWQAIEKAEAELKDALPEGFTFDLRDEMEQMLSGKGGITVERVLGDILKLLVGELGTFVQFGARFVLIVLMCNLLEALSSSFKSKNISKIGFFVCYMVVLLSVVQSFRIMIQLSVDVVSYLEQIMLLIVPMLLAFMASTGFAVSAGTMAPLIISALTLITRVVRIVLLPCIISIVVLEVLSAMSEEFKVDKWIALFYKGMKWVMTTMITVSLSLLGLYRLVLPGVDTTVKRATVKFSTAFIPIVGGAVGSTIDFIASGASLIKNSFSAGVIIWMLLILSVPLIKILAYTCVYEFAGAIIEPLGDKKMAKIATKLGKSCKFILSCTGLVSLFCICSIVICMTIHASGV